MEHDLQLVAKFKNGDERAFNELVNLYKKQIYFAVLRIVRNSEDAMDVAQDTFVRAYKSIRRFKGDSSFYTWLYRIAINLSLNHVNRNKTKDWQSFDELPQPIRSPKNNPDHHMERSDLQKLINRAISELPEKQRLIFILRYYEELSHKEIAEILGRSEGAVKANYFHAVKKLQSDLAEYERWVK